ncbi:MAG: hypothetical protein HC834_09305 [Rhodospirillales bacterium]|nr:hypothetical protein [Rhodospirillales bacterium]
MQVFLDEWNAANAEADSHPKCRHDDRDGMGSWVDQRFMKRTSTRPGSPDSPSASATKR